MRILMVREREGGIRDTMKVCTVQGLFTLTLVGFDFVLSRTRLFHRLIAVGFGTYVMYFVFSMYEYFWAHFLIQNLVWCVRTRFKVRKTFGLLRNTHAVEFGNEFMLPYVLS